MSKSIFIKNAVYTLISIIKILRQGIFDINLPKIENNKSDIYILGNGPSLKNNLNDYDYLFKSKDCMCVNNFAQSEYYEKIKPSSYIILDQYYWENYMSTARVEYRDKIFSIINLTTTWDMSLFIPIYAKNKLSWDRIFDNPNINIYYYNALPLAGFNYVIHRLYERNLGMPLAQNILVAAIFVAMNVGYKNIYIYGADHSWHEELVLNNENVVCLKDKHFYDNSKAELVPWKKNEIGGSTFKMHEILLALSKMFEGYQHLLEYSKYKQVDIINSSTKTNIDAFKRQNVLK